LLLPAAQKEADAMTDALRQRIRNIKILAELIAQIEIPAITVVLQNKVFYISGSCSLRLLLSILNTEDLCLNH